MFSQPLRFELSKPRNLLKFSRKILRISLCKNLVTMNSMPLLCYVRERSSSALILEVRAKNSRSSSSSCTFSFFYRFDMDPKMYQYSHKLQNETIFFYRRNSTQTTYYDKGFAILLFFALYEGWLE